jgi:hypothetical protein
MPRPKRYTATPTAADPNGITASVNPAGAVVLNIDGALAGTPGAGIAAFDRNGILTAATYTAGAIPLGTNAGTVGRSFDKATRITIFGGSDESDKNFTLTGRDSGGKLISEVLAGPNNTTVYSDLVYKSILKISLDTTTTGSDVEVGVLGSVTFTTPQHVATNVTTSSGDSIIVTGTDRTGAIITETIACTDATPVIGVKNFASVDKIESDGAMTAVVVGVSGTYASQWFGVDMYAENFNVYVAIDYATTGTFNVVTTSDDINASTFDESTAMAIDALTNSGDIAAITADGHGVIIAPFRALRLQTTVAQTGEVGMDIIQAI